MKPFGKFVPLHASADAEAAQLHNHEEIIMQIGHLELFVKEPLKSMEFYRDVLGCEVVAVQRDTFVWLSRGPIELLLRPGNGPSPAEQYNRTSTGIVLYTDDLQKTAAELTERGLQFNGTDGSDECLTFTDPDGHWFQLVNPNHA
jgi:catechol 2,3-dioxygenase-like lactoylglutathione lyase family enzyme